MRIPFLPNAAPGNERELRDFRGEKTPPPRALAHGADAESVRLKAGEARARGWAVDLEIGCGVGWHPIRYCAENPGRFLFAVEQTAEKFSKFRDRLTRHPDRENLFAVHADAIAWTVHAATGVEFDRVLILYPNPNPKNAAARWIRMPFFGFLLGRLAPGGTIHFRTNSAAYANEIREVATRRWGLRIVGSRELSRESGVPPITHFERKYLGRGEVCHEIILAKEEPANRG